MRFGVAQEATLIQGRRLSSSAGFFMPAEVTAE
jgi:hypothetical protein